jgi:hypothetical protein
MIVKSSLAIGLFLTNHLEGSILFLHLINMNKKTLTLLLLIVVFFAPAFSQSKSPLKKLYAYKQASVSGVKSSVTQENQKTKQSETYSYWFYLVFPRSEEMLVTEIWLSGKKFAVKSEPVNELPVKKINYTDPSGNSSVVIVPFTKNAVLLTYPVGESNDPAAMSKYFSDLISTYELVITYYWKGKKFYRVAKKITVLEPEVRV